MRSLDIVTGYSIYMSFPSLILLSASSVQTPDTSYSVTCPGAAQPCGLPRSNAQQVIEASAPCGRFGQQPVGPPDQLFVGQQTLEEYQHDWHSRNATWPANKYGAPRATELSSEVRQYFNHLNLRATIHI